VEWYPWLVLAHVIGAFGFVLGHGVSAHAAIQLRREREPARVTALLDLSSLSLATLYVSLLVLLAAGIAAGFVGDHWGRLWIWVAIGILVVLVVFMYAVASPYYADLRRAVGQKAYGDKKDAAPPEPLDAAALAARLDSARPYWLAGVGSIGLVAIVWLMVLKPF
jgi:hypothetical protein